MSLSEDIEEAQWKAGLRHKPSHVHHREVTTEKMDPDTWTDRALAIFKSDFGGHYSEEDITAAASEVIDEWREKGREVLMTASDASSLAAQTGNKLFHGGRGFDPTRAPKEAAGGFSEQLKAHQKDRGIE